MIRKTTRINRLQKVHNFLLKLDPENFDFSEWITDWNDKHTCGTVCCAVGWMPVIDPKNWKWNPNRYRASLRGKRENWHTDDAAMIYFGMTMALMEFIFVPNSQTDDIMEVNQLSDGSTPKEVAKHIGIVIKALKNDELDDWLE